MARRKGSLNVLVGWDLSPVLLGSIAASDSRIHLLNHTVPALGTTSELWPPFPAQLLPLLVETEVLFTLRIPLELTTQAPNLRWVHSLAAGVDGIANGPLADTDVVLTTSSGIHAIPLAESVIGAILALAKGFPDAIRRQDRREWLRYQPGEVFGKTAGIVGAGHIGTRVAELCRALGMRTIGIRRTMPPIETSSPSTFDQLMSNADLPTLLAESDFVVVTAPSTPGSRGMIGRDQLSQMKRGARLINVARGDLVDEPAVVEALQSGHLAGAYLDVFQTEPLPVDSLLWEMPNVIITAHSGAGSPNSDERAVDLFLDNVDRHLSGRPLRNVYNRDRGY